MAWSVSPYEEGPFRGDFPSKAEAIESGKSDFSGDCFYIGENHSPEPLSEGVFASELIDNAINNLATWQVDVARLLVSEEQEEDLQVRLRSVIAKWVADWGIEPDWYIVKNIVSVPESDESEEVE